MNLRPHHFQESTFQIAPLIDIVFNLLFFFLALSIFYQIELQIGITLPQAENADPGRRHPNQVVVNVDAEGRFFISQRQFTAQQLSDILSRFAKEGRQQTVIVRGDRSTPYEYIVEVLDLCRGAGVVDYALATLPEESGPTEGG